MKKAIKEPVAILGYGVEGHAALVFLKGLGLKDITICDENPNIEMPEDCQTRLGKDAFKDLKDFSAIFRSPGVHYDLPGIREARRAGCTITSLTELTLEEAGPRLTAITGSNGKTTVVAMLEAILKDHYKGKIIVGGNDRKPVLEEVLKNPDWPVLLEVSSFQFADIHQSPHVAAVLNITPNHMDWHENLEDYVHAKANLIAHQDPNDWAILNDKDENSRRLADKSPGQIFWINKQEGKAWAAWKEDDLIARFGSEEQTILKRSDISIKTHPDNLLCTAAVSLIHKVDLKTIKDNLSHFKGVEHRMEFVRELGGINFFNDSACTTPESARVAITQFPEGKLVLLLGGSSKNADFSFLAHHIADSRTKVCLYGEEAGRIREALKSEGAENLIVGFDATGDFTNIVTTAFESAQPGDSIVLSPACASFDMFKNSKDRGSQFKEVVGAILFSAPGS